MLELAPEREDEFARMFEMLRAGRRGGISGDEAELAFISQLIREADEGGMVPHNGQMYRVTPQATDYLAGSTVAALAKAGRVPPALLAALGALALMLVVYVIYMLVAGSPAAAPPRTPTRGAALASPTLTVSGAIPLTSPTVVPVLPPTVVVAEPTLPANFPSVAGEKLPPSRPNTLTLAERSFVVVPARVVSNTWTVAADPGQASWLDGATINWTFALLLDGDPATRAWGNALQVPLTATLRTADGRARQFVLTESATISRAETEYMSRTWAGLTLLVRLDAGDTRRLLRGGETLPAGTADAAPLQGGDPLSPTP